MVDGGDASREDSGGVGGEGLRGPWSRRPALPDQPDGPRWQASRAEGSGRARRRCPVFGRHPHGGGTARPGLELHAERWAPLSRVYQESRAKLISTGLLGRMKVAALRVEDVDRWMLRMRKDGVGPASVRNQLSVLRAALAQAVKWDWIDRNPAALASNPVRAATTREWDA